MATTPHSSPNTTSGCPYHNSTQLTGDKVERPNKPIYQNEAGGWHVHDYNAARAILRSNQTIQAGFQADKIKEFSLGREPMLFMEGAEHLALRKNTAKYFTPKHVAQYEDMIQAFVDDQLAELEQNKQVDISNLSVKLASSVASRIVGLTNSPIHKLTKRLSNLLESDPIPDEATKLQYFKALFLGQLHSLNFFFRDVIPAINQRKKSPEDDLISHLLDKGYTNLEILTECILFGAAGMATTREFISVATWHFLQNDTLKADYLSADEPTRHEILHEILRLEPVVGALHRKATEPITVEIDGETTHIATGDTIHLQLYHTNEDSSIFGANTESVCPHRDLPKGVHAPGMSFGDGAHRCPGAYIAIKESDMFLTQLLEIGTLRIKQPPIIKRNDIIEGYEIRDFWVTVD